MRSSAAAALAAAVVAVALAGVGTLAPAGAAAPRAKAAPAVASVSALASAVLAQVNVVRREHHLVALTLSPRLSAAAAEHSEQMGVDGYFEHQSADGSPFWKRIERYYPSSGFAYWSVGENLLWASPGVDAPGALTMWMHSPEHRANLLAPRWRQIGVAAVKVQSAPGAYRGLDVTIITTDFGVRR